MKPLFWWLFCYALVLNVEVSFSYIYKQQNLIFYSEWNNVATMFWNRETGIKTYNIHVVKKKGPKYY